MLRCGLSRCNRRLYLALSMGAHLELVSMGLANHVVLRPWSSDRASCRWRIVENSA